MISSARTLPPAMGEFLDELLAGVTTAIPSSPTSAGDSAESSAKKAKTQKDPKNNKKGKDAYQALTLMNSEAVLALMQRMRAAESMIFEFFKVPAQLVIPLAAKACGQRIAETRKAMRAQNKTYKLANPIHSVVWLAVLLEWGKSAFASGSQEHSELEAYLLWAKTSNNMKQICQDIPYFRRLDMHDKNFTKLIVCCGSEGSSTCKLWTHMVRWMCSHGAERLQGMAPRNSKERKIAKALDKLKGKTPAAVLAAADSDDDD